MDVCLTSTSAFLHCLTACQLSIKQTASCDEQEEEEAWASKQQHPVQADQKQAQNQDQEQQQISEHQTVRVVLCPPHLQLLLSLTAHVFVSFRNAVRTLSRRLHPLSVGSVGSGLVSARKRAGPIPEPRSRLGASSSQAAAESSECRTPDPGERSAVDTYTPVGTMG